MNAPPDGAGKAPRVHPDELLAQVTACVHYHSISAVCAALASTLATALGCERVAIGMRRGRHMHIEGLSHSARFERRSNLARAVAEAMDEAYDQRANVCFPAIGKSAEHADRAHRQLVERFHSAGACTVLLYHGKDAVGAITVESRKSQTLEADTVAIIEQVARLTAPTLALLHQRERSPLRWFAPAHAHRGEAQGTIWRRRNLLLALLGAGLVFSLTPATYRITAKATLEGQTQRVVAAPVAGYLADAQVRAGDRVSAGQLMATLDDKDLRLEETRWDSERQQLVREYREALAKHERAQANILSARLQQAEARLKLIRAQLARLTIVAPFDGVVLQGDLHQSLGAPVQRGDVLYKVAPHGDYRLILQVDESEIGHVDAGQQGWLTLTSLPHESLGFTVERVTPVSTPEDGRNYFRVEAQLDAPLGPLRPGMQGVGKLDAGERQRVWIWTHTLVERLRLWLWSIWP